MITRLTHRLTRAQQAATVLAIAVFCHLSVATASAAPVADLEGKLGELTEKLTTYGRGLAGLAFIIVFLSWICEPALPSWARENKGIFARIIVGCVGLGLAPDIVAFVFG
jgi:type IV secretory pathway VirB2 component (pilin)